MKVILKTDVEHVGRAGDIKEVSGGFGRNFLLPRGLAMPATSGAVRWWEKGREKRSAAAGRRQTAAQELAGKLAGVSLSFAREAGPEGKLFGSVGKSDIVKSIKTCGYEVDKAWIVLESPLKNTGEFEVEVRIHPDVSAKVKVSVVPRQ